MSPRGKDGGDKFESLVSDFLNRTNADERLNDVLADAFPDEESADSLSPEAVERAKAAVAKGMFDGATQRARGKMTGALTTFPNAIRRIREASRRSPEQMAARASIDPELWTNLEDQRLRFDEIDAVELASVVEAIQVSVGELEPVLRRTESVRLVQPARASFRADRDAMTDQTAAYESLMLTLADEEGGSSQRDSDDTVSRVVGDVVAELKRRGRMDLL